MAEAPLYCEILLLLPCLSKQSSAFVYNDAMDYLAGLSSAVGGVLDVL